MQVVNPLNPGNELASGKAPVNALLLSISDDKEIKFVKVVGRVPLKLLYPRLSVVSDVN